MFIDSLETMPSDLAELVSAVSARDYPGEQGCALCFKGACNMIGALAAGELAYGLDKRALAAGFA